jgi:hypothetical protein
MQTCEGVRLAHLRTKLEDHGVLVAPYPPRQGRAGLEGGGADEAADAVGRKKEEEDLVK